MPDNQPNNAPAETPKAPRDDTDQARVIAEEQREAPVGGGGLGGAAAADATGNSSTPPGGATRNAPFTAPVPDLPQESEDRRTQADAARDAAAVPPPEPHPSSL